MQTVLKIMVSLAAFSGICFQVQNDYRHATVSWALTSFIMLVLYVTKKR